MRLSLAAFTLQVYDCTECLHRFTGEPGKNKNQSL
jgi:hypothetical protein